MVTMTNEVESWGSPHYKFYGLAKDTKPTENVPENSEFRELDTGADFYFSEGLWHPSPASSDGGSSSACAEPFIVMLTAEGSTITGNATFGEIFNAKYAGQTVALNLGENNSSSVLDANISDNTVSLAFVMNGQIAQVSGAADSAISMELG